MSYFTSMTTVRNKVLRIAGLLLPLTVIVVDAIMPLITGNDIMDTDVAAILISSGLLIALLSFRDYEELVDTSIPVAEIPQTLYNLNTLLRVGAVVVLIDVIVAFLEFDLLFGFPIILINLAFVVVATYYIHIYKKYTTDSFLLKSPLDILK